MKLRREREIQDNFRVKRILAADTGNFHTTRKSARSSWGLGCVKSYRDIRIRIPTPSLRVKSVSIKRERPGKHL